MKKLNQLFNRLLGKPRRGDFLVVGTATPAEVLRGQAIAYDRNADSEIRRANDAELEARQANLRAVGYRNMAAACRVAADQLQQSGREAA